jgi:hypothetical protein
VAPASLSPLTNPERIGRIDEQLCGLRKETAEPKKQTATTVDLQVIPTIPTRRRTDRCMGIGHVRGTAKRIAFRRELVTSLALTFFI